MATGVHRPPGRSWRDILQRGKEIVADLDALPAHGEAWTDQQREGEGAEPPGRADPYEDGLAIRPDIAEMPPGALEWWADPSAAVVSSQERRSIRRVQAHLGWRRMLR